MTLVLVPISALPSASPLTGDELIAVVQSGVTEQTTVGAIGNFGSSNSIKRDNTAPPTADISWAGFGIKDLSLIKDTSLNDAIDVTNKQLKVGAQVKFDWNLGLLGNSIGAFTIDVENNRLKDSTGNDFVKFDSRSNGLGFGTNGQFAYFKTTNLTGTKTIEWQNKDYTGVADITDITALSSVYMPLSGGTFTGNVNGVTPTELNYISGVTSAIQTQLNSKQSTLSGTGFVKSAGGVISYDTSTYVTSIGVTTANGVSGSSSGGATPSLTISLGAITPTSVNGLTLSTASSTQVRTGLNVTAGLGTLRNTGFGSVVQMGNQDTTAFGSTVNIPNNVNNAVYVGSQLNNVTPVAKARTFLYGVNIQIANTNQFLSGANITTTGSDNIIIAPSNTSTVTYTGSGYIGLLTGTSTVSGAVDGCTQIGNSTILQDSQQHSTLVGQLGKIYLDATYGSDGGEQVGYGYKVVVGSWRGTAIGAYSQALAVSTTSLGYGSCSIAAHSSSWGRGSYNQTGASTVLYNGTTNNTLFLGGAYAAHYNPAIPEAYDTVSAQNAGTKIYTVTTNSGLDVNQTPTYTNVRGAILDIQGGLSTGTALGGEIRFRTSPVGASGNTLNTSIICAQFDAVATGGSEQSRFMLLDLTTGTLKRISFGANDSGGTGYKYLRVAN